MPLPSPKKDEKQEAFVNRCMGSSVTKKDFPDKEQRLAVCFSRFRKSSASVELTQHEEEALRFFILSLEHGDGKKKKKKRKKKYG